MRLLIKLKSDNQFLPFNYNYPLSSAIYNLLRIGTPEFAQLLHDKGFKVNNKTYKLFSFALLFEKYSFGKEGIKLESPYVKLIIASPILEDFFKGILLGSFRVKELMLNVNGNKHLLGIKQIEEIREPEFANNMRFSMLSPLVVSTRKEYNGKMTQYFLRSTDDGKLFTEIINKNLINKYNLYHEKEYEGEGIDFKFDEEYLKKKKYDVQKKITLAVRKNKIDIIGIISPFYVTGDPKLIKVGYECGFGEKNSMGFGLAKPI